MNIDESYKRERINYPWKNLKIEDLDEDVMQRYKALLFCIFTKKLTPTKVLSALNLIRNVNEDFSD